MGNEQSKEGIGLINRGKLYCCIDFAVLSIEEFRVLGCGRYFCVECLEDWYTENIVNCPKCREKEVQ